MLKEMFKDIMGSLGVVAIFALIFGILSLILNYNPTEFRYFNIVLIGISILIIVVASVALTRK